MGGVTLRVCDTQARRGHIRAGGRHNEVQSGENAGVLGPQVGCLRAAAENSHRENTEAFIEEQGEGDGAGEEEE